MDNSTLAPRGDQNYDKLGKVRPIIDAVREQFLRAYDPHQQSSIDEAMIAFKGRSTLKQYVPKKPIKRGFKAWVRADAVTGYVCDFDIYTGKTEGEREYGLGGSVVKRLTDCLNGMFYTIFCDNFFTSAQLFTDLLSNGVYACGTYNRTRKCYPSDLQSVAKSGLPQRGDALYRQEGNLLTSLWQDKKTVSFLSTCCQPTSDITVKRRQKDGTRIDVKCPEAVYVYNKFMGGVDKNDQLRGYYSVRTKSVKSYKYIFWFIFDLAVTNAFLLYQYSPAVGRILTLKEFRVELAKQLIGSYNSRKYRGRPSGPNSCRIHKMKMAHYPVKISKGRCRNCTTGYTTWYCNECEKRLYHTGDPESDCFLKFHMHGYMMPKLSPVTIIIQIIFEYTRYNLPSHFHTNTIM